ANASQASELRSIDAPDVALPRLLAYRRGRPRAASPPCYYASVSAVASRYARGPYSRPAALDYGDSSLRHRLLPHDVPLRVVVPPLPAANPPRGSHRRYVFTHSSPSRIARTSFLRCPNSSPSAAAADWRVCFHCLCLAVSLFTLLDRCLEKLRGSVGTGSRCAQLVQVSPTAFSLPFVFTLLCGLHPFTDLDQPRIVLYVFCSLFRLQSHLFISP
ncbi:hypothetical protein K438DRAFT_2014916, partial [Mycena galopus ATCC 62051]